MNPVDAFMRKMKTQRTHQKICVPKFDQHLLNFFLHLHEVGGAVSIVGAGLGLDVLAVVGAVDDDVHAGDLGGCVLGAVGVQRERAAGEVGVQIKHTIMS